MKIPNLTEVFLLEAPAIPELKELVPNGTSEQLEQLYYALAWVAGFMGGRLPDEKMSDIFWKIEGVSSPRVTGGKFDWSDAGKKAAQNMKQQKKESFGSGNSTSQGDAGEGESEVEGTYS